MRSGMFVRLIMASLAMALAASCAEERDPVNTLPVYSHQKSYFIGKDFNDSSDDPEYYMQATLVDVPYGSNHSSLFTSSWAHKISRVKFQITEDMLIARLTYEYLSGSDGKGVGRTSIDGTVVAAYRIIQHFDPARAYNPTTGEEINVIGPNRDRPWMEREWIEVDWSRNVHENVFEFDTLALAGLYGGVRYQPLDFYVQDANSPYAPHFEMEQGYFDVTQELFAAPAMLDLSRLGWGMNSFPACMLGNVIRGGTAPTAQCVPVELKFRLSFRKVEDTDYEPQHWDGERFRAFGAFTEDRYGYSRKVGMSDSLQYRMIARYNIWEQSHYYDSVETKSDGTIVRSDPVACFVPVGTAGAIGTAAGVDPNRDLNADGTADECKDVSSKPIDDDGTTFTGSQCDHFNQKCTLPYRARVAKPIVWYVTSGSNFEFYDGTDWSTHEWDVALRNAVIVARYTECIKTKGRPADCAKNYPVITGESPEEQMAIKIAWEVDACRHGVRDASGALLYSDENDLAADPDDLTKSALDEYGQPWCDGLAKRLATERGASKEVLFLVKQKEMGVLCHSPVEHNDHPLCFVKKSDLPKGKDYGYCAKQLRAGKDACGLSANIILPEDNPQGTRWSSALCAAAVRANDLELMDRCGKALNARLGDLRFNQINLLDQPQSGSPWGIMADSSDPLTGEKVASSVNVWTDVTDFWSQRAVDYLRYMKGELTDAEVTEGTYIKDYAQAALAASRGVLPRYSAADVRKNIDAVMDADFSKFDMKALAANPSVRAQAAEMRARLSQVHAEWSQSSSSASRYRARLQSAIGSDLEAELLTKMMLDRVGDRGALSEAERMALASPFRMANPQVSRELNQLLERGLVARGACMMNEAPAPYSFVPLAKILESKFEAFNPGDSKTKQFERAEKMRRYIAQKAHYNVLAHEMGHSVGLRHNFVSSSSAYNFRPQYWQLRTRNGAVTTECTDITTDPDACVGPRYFDPMSQDEVDNLLPMFMQSSIMEYAGETTQDFIGLGTYDFAAARMFYGDAATMLNMPGATYTNVGTEDDPRVPYEAVISLLLADNIGGMLGFTYDTLPGFAAGNDTAPESLHYSQLQRRLGLINNCRPAPKGGSDETLRAAYMPKTWDQAKYGKWHPLLDGHFVKLSGSNDYTICDTQKVDFVPWSSLQRVGIYSNREASPTVDAMARPRYPYGFATDRWADLGNLAVYRHDNGADAYELFDFFIGQQEMNHIFDAYRRGRTTFSVWGASAGLLSRYNEKMRDSAKGLGLFVNIFRENALKDGTKPGAAMALLSNDYASNLLASAVAFDHFARMLARPMPGEYYRTGWAGDDVLHAREATEVRIVYKTDAAGRYVFENGERVVEKFGTEMVMPLGAYGDKYQNINFGGQLVENRYLEKECGDYCSEYVINAGSYYQKAFVPMLLTESVDNFISDSAGDFTDPRYRNVGMADIFYNAFRRLLANSLTGDESMRSPAVLADATGKIQVVSDDKDNLDLTPASGIGWIQWTGKDGPRRCYNSSNDIGHPGTSGQFYECNTAPAGAKEIALDAQIGWEQWKFLIAMSMAYLPENQRRDWLDSLRMWEIGADNDPGFDPLDRIDYESADGAKFVARSIGTETVFGKTVQKGIASRVLEWANTLKERAYELEPDGKFKRSIDRKPIVKYDARLQDNPEFPLANPTCSETDNSGCTCSDNIDCLQLEKYESLLYFFRTAATAYRLPWPGYKGVY